MTDHPTALDTARQAFSKADQRYNAAILARLRVGRAWGRAERALQNTSRIRSNAATKLRHAVADAATLDQSTTGRKANDKSS